MLAFMAAFNELMACSTMFKNGLLGDNFLRANVSMHQTNSSKSPKFVFTPTFIFCSPICSNNCGVVFCENLF